MANGNSITISGNATSAPELRYGQSGVAVANMSVAVNERKFDREKNEWVEGEATFVRVTLWRDMAENAAGTVNKGDRVMVTGALKVRSYEDKEGNQRTSTEIEVEDFGVSLRFATAAVTRVPKGGAGRAPAAPAQDAWATPGYTEETPW